MLLCIATMLSLCTGFASAASSTIGGALGEVNITNGDYKMSYLSMNGVVRSPILILTISRQAAQ